MELISIPELARLLHIRPKRIVEKLRTMDIHIEHKNKLMHINMTNVRLLANEYTSSKRTSQRTQKYAQELLFFLDKGTDDLSLLFSRTDQNVRTKQKSLLSKSTNKQTMNSSIKNQSSDQYVLWFQISQYVQKVLLTCVQSLESLYFKFFALLVAICVQMNHTALWFYRVTPEASSSWLSAYGYAVMLDLFILVVTLEGRLSIAKTFAGLTFISNLLYFQFWVVFDGSIFAYTQAISCILISATIAFILYSYTEIFVKYQKAKIHIKSD